MSALNLNLKVGDKIRHFKRGSFYLIIGRATASHTLQDNAKARLIVERSGYFAVVDEHMSESSIAIDVPLLFQRSINPAIFGTGSTDAFIYREFSERMIYARPVYEFTEDRFEKVTA
jgi:hypothetical protein